MIKNLRIRLALQVILAFPAAASAIELTLAFRAVQGDAPLALDAPETLVAVGPNQLSLTRASALVSSVALVRPDGGFAQLEGQFGALDLAAARDRFTLRGVPPGRYQGLQFLVGLRPAANHGDPAVWPADHALNPLVNRLHWNWQGGYIFLALEGRYRRADASLGGWSFHLATDERLTLVTIPYAFALESDSTLAFDLDLGRMLEGLVLAPTTDTTHSRPGDSVADRLAQNLPASFRLRSFSLSPAAAPVAAPLLPEFPPHTKTAQPVPFDMPPGFPQVALPADNPLTAEGIALGESLFHDPRLSGDGTQSCSDCHQSAHAFSDPRPLSLGIAGLPGTRHSMPLFNLAWSPRYAWDGSQARIRDQALAALSNPLEMHADPQKIAALLAADPAMQNAFTVAFGPLPHSPTSLLPTVSPVTAERIGLALEQHLLTLVSADSRLDRALRGEIALTELEKEGFALFATERDLARGQRGADCFHCHGGPLFTDYQPKHNGLDLVSKDPGRAVVTGLPADAGKFKTPSLRNIALTAPYMHDGRIATLEEVVAHYDQGVERAANLDPNLAKHAVAGLQLTSDEKSALLAFLHTLTDERFSRTGRDAR